MFSILIKSVVMTVGYQAALSFIRMKNPNCFVGPYLLGLLYNVKRD